MPPGEAVITGVAATTDALYVAQTAGPVSSSASLSNSRGRDAEKPPFDGDVDALARPPATRVLFDLGGWMRFGSYYVYDPNRENSPIRSCNRRANTILRAISCPPDVKAKAPTGRWCPSRSSSRKASPWTAPPTIPSGTARTASPRRLRSAELPWLEQGGVLAIAHVRGGGEYGEDWHQAGIQATKPNTCATSIACAQYLIENKYTSPRLASPAEAPAASSSAARSRAPGPLRRGDRRVAASDSLRSEPAANGVPNIPEFGTVKTEDGFKALYAMNAYHHVKDGVPYPAVLLTTGINDPRVDAWQAAKMTARLQAATSSGKPMLLRVDYDAGHGVGSTKNRALRGAADDSPFCSGSWASPASSRRPCN